MTCRVKRSRKKISFFHNSKFFSLLFFQILLFYIFFFPFIESGLERLILFFCITHILLMRNIFYIKSSRLLIFSDLFCGGKELLNNFSSCEPRSRVFVFFSFSLVVRFFSYLINNFNVLYN